MSSIAFVGQAPPPAPFPALVWSFWIGSAPSVGLFPFPLLEVGRFPFPFPRCVDLCRRLLPVDDAVFCNKCSCTFALCYRTFVIFRSRSLLSSRALSRTERNRTSGRCFRARRSTPGLVTWQRARNQWPGRCFRTQRAWSCTEYGRCPSGKTQLTAPQTTKTFSAGLPIMHQSRNSPAPRILTLCHIVTRSQRLGLLVRSPPASPIARSTFLGAHVNNLLADDAQLLKVVGSVTGWALGRLTPVILTTCHRGRHSLDVAVFLGLKDS